jgi:hypothetical protein
VAGNENQDSLRRKETGAPAQKRRMGWLKDTVANGYQDGRNGKQRTYEASTPLLSREA